MLSVRGLAGGIAVLLAVAGPAWAQTGVPSTGRPTVSPYLNLTRRGQSPALNYYNLVRPQVEFYSSIQQLQQQVGSNRSALNTLEQAGTQSGLPPTGFIPQFQTHRAYFQTYSGGGAGMPPAGLRPASRPSASRGR